MSTKQNKTQTGEKITQSKEYTLKAPIIQKGKEVKAGGKVKLREQQAEKLKGSGHI